MGRCGLDIHGSGHGPGGGGGSYEHGNEPSGSMKDGGFLV
jgi:hypothetical protein